MPEEKNQQSQEVNQEMNGFKLFWTIIKTYYLQMILLNLLFIVSCIPIVTIGPALYALNTVTMSFARQKPIQPILEYREAFKTHFLKHMLIGLSVALLAGALVLSLNFYFNVASLTVLFYLAIILEFSVAIIIAAGTMYLFKLLVLFDQPMKVQIKNALLFSVGAPGVLIKILIFIFIPVYVLIKIPVFGILLAVLILIISASVVTSILTWNVMKGYTEEA